MSTVTRPLVVFTGTTVCDGPRAQHEVTLWTDGTRAYAAVVGHDGETTVDRDTTQVEVTCGHPVGADARPCPGYARFDLTDECWTADKAAIDMLVSYGEVIER